MSYSEPPPPPPNYGPTPTGGLREHPKGTTILILGILSLVCCGLFTGIPAIVMGRKATAEINAQPGTFTNAGTVKAGYICGIIGTALSVLGLLFYLVVMIAAIGTGGLDGTLAP